MIKFYDYKQPVSSQIKNNKSCQKTMQLTVNAVWAKYESYILHTSAVMYTFQTLNRAVNDKVWPDLELRKGWKLLKGLNLR